METRATRTARERKEWMGELSRKAFWIVFWYAASCVLSAWGLNSSILWFSNRQPPEFVNFWSCLLVVAVPLEFIFRSVCAYYRSASMRLYLYDINARLAELGVEMASMEGMSEIDADVDADADVEGEIE